MKLDNPAVLIRVRHAELERLGARIRRAYAERLDVLEKELASDLISPDSKRRASEELQSIGERIDASAHRAAQFLLQRGSGTTTTDAATTSTADVMAELVQGKKAK